MSTLKPYLKRIERFFARRKQQLIIAYLLHCCGGRELVKKYTKEYTNAPHPIGANSPIWTCWWQGEDAMPDIVKACYNAMQRFADGHPVILITEKNYKDYIEFPDYILHRLQDGALDLTHFSDILRMALLTRHGGIWMDSTLLLPAKPIGSFICPNAEYWSCHHHTRYNNVSQGGWVSFFVACGKGNILSSFISDLHFNYWKTHKKLVDYLLLDYAFAVAHRYIPAVHDMVEHLPFTEMGPLGKCLNEEYSEKNWNEYCTRYNFHKVTYKIPLRTVTSEGKKTNYGHILDTFLPKKSQHIS